MDMWISRKKFEDMKTATENLIDAVKDLQNKAFLIGIERQGRENVFTFLRGEQFIEIRTMGLISDNLPEWKERLIR